MKCTNGIGGGKMYELWDKGVPTDLAWQEVAKPVEVLVGCKLIAFDPNFVFRMKDGSQANVPFTFIMELSHQLSDSMIIDNIYYKNLKKNEEHGK